MLVRVVSADYQNGNTKKAFTRNVYRGEKIAMSNDLDALRAYAESVRILAPLYIEDKDTDERVRNHIAKRKGVGVPLPYGSP